jgi:hypothetical protein
VVRNRGKETVELASFNIIQFINLLLGLYEASRQSQYVKPVTIDGMYKREEKTRFNTSKHEALNNI